MSDPIVFSEIIRFLTPADINVNPTPATDFVYGSDWGVYFKFDAPYPGTGYTGQQTWTFKVVRTDNPSVFFGPVTGSIHWSSGNFDGETDDVQNDLMSLGTTLGSGPYASTYPLYVILPIAEVCTAYRPFPFAFRDDKRAPQSIVEWIETQGAGTYQIVEDSLGVVSPSFEIRFLVADNVQVSPPKYDPEVDGDATITGDWKALPASSSWTPSMSLPTTVYLNVGTYNSPLVDPMDGGLLPTPAPAKIVYTETLNCSLHSKDPDGKIGSFSFTWDGTNRNVPGKAAYGQYVPVITGATNSADAVGPVYNYNLFTYPDGDPGYTGWPGAGKLVCTECNRNPLAGSSTMQMALDLLSSPFDLDMSTILSYNNTNSAQVPASMGYGWSSTDHVRVSLDTSGNLYYRDETNNSLRWNLSGGSFVPFNANNYVKAVHDTTNHWYVLTFKDQSQRIFSDTTFKLLKTLDRNGNYLSYSYDSATGRITQITDSTPSARTIVYGYANSTDLQPQTITAGTRVVQLGYNSSNQLQTITSPAGDVTTYSYNAAGYIETIKDPTNTTAVSYTYDSIGRVLTQTSYTNQSMLTYDYGYDAIAQTLGVCVSMTLTDLTSPNPSPEQITVQFFDTNFNVTEIHELVDLTTRSFVCFRRVRTIGISRALPGLRRLSA